MTRIAAEECEYTDVEWYAIDRQGHIAVFCSAGTGNLPEFVCSDAERTNALKEYFHSVNQASDTIFKQSEDKVAAEFSNKGLFYYDAYNGTELLEDYKKQSEPTTPLIIEQLPLDVQEILSSNKLDIESFLLVDNIHVEHAY